jgi:RNA polymerase sigma factor (sigma-70 family)
MDEKDIVSIRNGDLTPLDKVYLELKPAFMNMLGKKFKTITNQDLEDVYQESIIALYQNIQRGTLTEFSSSISAYVFRIGSNLLNDLLRKRQKEQELISNGSRLEHLLNEVYNPQIDYAVDYIYAQMGEKCRRILTMFYSDRKSHQEIAQELSYSSADSVKVKKHRCISDFIERTKNKMNYELGNE